MDPIAADGDLDGDKALTLAGGQRPRRGRLLFLLLALVGAGAWFLWVWGQRDSGSGGKRSENATGASVVNQPRGVPARPPLRPVALAITPRATPKSTAVPEPPVVVAGDDDPRTDGGPVHPHPITPERVRIQRENNLVGALDGAMDVNDGAGLRKLLDQYRDEYPDDPNRLQDGYRVIADCLQYPGAASTAAAQRYYDQERGSMLRRFVARHCLEP